MLSEAPSTRLLALSPRAGIALLTLQLRASVREAEAAEAADVAADHEAIREELRARLEPLVDERRRVLDAALAAARAEAATAVAAARHAASDIVAGTSPSVVADVPTAVAPVALVAPVSPVAPPATAVEHTVEPVTGPAALAPLSELPPPRGAAVVEGPALPALPPRSQPGPITVVIDAEAFARVFATVMATVLDERFAAWGAGVPLRPGLAQPPVAAPLPAKQSFWSHARHPDVLLMGLAGIILLVVVAAWLG